MDMMFYSNKPEELKTFYYPEKYCMCDEPTAIHNAKRKELFDRIPGNTEALVFPPSGCNCSVRAWKQLPDDLPKSIKVIDLGYDGILYNSIENPNGVTQIIRVLSQLPDIKTVYYCGYYSSIDYLQLNNEFPKVKFVENL